MPNDQKVRKELLGYLDRAHAHAPFEMAAKDLPTVLINKKLPKFPYTPWMLIEHIRRTQNDMLDFMHNKNYESRRWPRDYWPDVKEKVDKRMWAESIKEYKEDLAAVKKMINDPKIDLFKKISGGGGQTVFLEVMQVIDHTAYHTGELILMRRAMGAWKG